MSKVKKALVGSVLVGTFIVGASAPAFAGPPTKCNSGRGNLSETDPSNDCDPGRSGGNNQGGD